MSRKRILVTGAAGFIGYHVAKALLARGDVVLGVDSLNDYYDPALKRARLQNLQSSSFEFQHLNIADQAALNHAVGGVDGVIHLAAQAGVRHSYEHPEAFVPANLVGFYNVAALAMAAKVQHFVFASTSSVYGANPTRPFRETASADHPLSLYAATKKANEAMAHALAHIHQTPTTGLRFFTVYGPWGRPDMSFFRFADRIIRGAPIELHNHGRMTRDFTYIDDIVAGILAAYDRPAEVDHQWIEHPSPATSGAAPYRIFNIGSGAPVNLATYVDAFEAVIGKKAIREYVEMHPGEAVDTHADAGALQQWTGYKPTMSLKEGVGRFVDWYRGYYDV